jgi:arylalkylamine N-acetyltransferase
MGLMDLIDSKFDIFALYPHIDSFVDGKILSVDPRYRGHGIAGLLTQKTIEYMQEKNIEIFHILCTSHYSARVCEKSDFTEVFTLPFTDYVDSEGNQILCPEKPHVAARIFTKKVCP